MKRNPEKAARGGVLCGLLLLLASPLALGQSTAQGASAPLLAADGTKASKSNTVVVYTPPRRGAPGRRMSGGTRTSGTNTTVVIVLTPETMGLTIRAQPTLYWYLSENVAKHVILTVVDENAIDPIVEATLAPPAQPGIQALDLASLGVRLEPEQHYEWEIALLDPSGDRHRDVYARGAIERVEPSADLRAKLATGSPLERAKALAEAGIWYDAMDEVSRAIDSSADAGMMRAARKALLAQVNLNEVATEER